MLGMGQEIPLSGGQKTDGVVRVGDTVRRPTGPWTPRAHALLHHLERVGFAGAPRVLGLDAQGREILTWIDGVTIWPDAPDTLETDENLARAARLVGDFHRAASTFPEGQMLHGDLGTWNVIVGPQWAIIDWDDVENGPVEWEIAYCLHAFLWLSPRNQSTDAEISRRMQLFADGYQLLRRQLLESVDLIAESCEHICRAIQREASVGGAPALRMIADGALDEWSADAEHVRSRAPTWRRALSA